MQDVPAHGFATADDVVRRSDCGLRSACPACRRQQLVLLERAFGLVQDARAARIPTDAAVWNALVTAAGRAGQLQRAFEVSLGHARHAAGLAVGAPALPGGASLLR